MDQAFLFHPNGMVVELPLPLSCDVKRYIRSVGNTVYLFDAAGNTAREPVRIHNCFTIMAASPNKGHYQQFLNHCHIKYFMPCWTLPEMLCVENYLPTETVKQVKHRFEQFGGIPRFVWCDSTAYEIYQTTLEDTLNSLSLKRVERFIDGSEILPEESHWIFQYEVAEDYIHKSLRFATPSIAQQATAKFAKEGGNSLANCVLATRSAPAVCGYLFEEYAHHVLVRGGVFRGTECQPNRHSSYFECTRKQKETLIHRGSSSPRIKRLRRLERNESSRKPCLLHLNEPKPPIF